MSQFVDKYVAIARSLIRYTPRRRKYSDFGRYDLIVDPGVVSPLRPVPARIRRPRYALLDSSASHDDEPIPAEAEAKRAAQIEGVRAACRAASAILAGVAGVARAGATTDDIDAFVHDECLKRDAYPSPLLYRGFPKSACTSVNNVAAHGIPDDRPLKDGDTVNVDVTVYKDGFHGDCSRNFLVGDVDEQGRELVEVDELCLAKGIAACGPGVPFKEVGFVVQDCARRHGYAVVPALTGHGIGEYFHGPPDIYHTHNFYPGRMRPGMTFTIEPVISCGTEALVMLEDGWTLVTEDGARAAQTEHTVLITDDGCTILTDQH